MPYEQSQLANGCTLITERMDGVRSVSLGIWFRVGSRDETANQRGISHFMEHMMFKGTATRSALDISTAFDALGAELNAFTSKEYTCYYVRTLDEHLPKALEVLGDMVTNSAFTDEAISSEREVVIEEIARSEDAPDDYVFELFSQAVFPTHQLGRPILGTREIVGGFQHPDCAAYHSAHYHAGNIIVVASGNIAHQQLVGLCEQHLGSIGQGQTNDRGAVSEGEREYLSVYTKDTEQAHMLLGMPGVSLGEDDRYASALLETALGGPMSSRLFQEVREKRGLAYAVFASTTAYMNAAQFAIYLGTRPSNLTEACAIVRAELLKMLEIGMDACELERIRDYLIGHIVLGMESTQARMIRLGKSAINGLELLSLEQWIERYRSVTLDDIRRVAERLLSQKPSIAVVSPLEQPEVAAMLGA